MKFTIVGKHGWVYPGELVDESGELFTVKLDEMRFDEHGIASYVVDGGGNQELVRFSLAQVVPYALTTNSGGGSVDIHGGTGYLAGCLVSTP